MNIGIYWDQDMSARRYQARSAFDLVVASQPNCLDLISSMYSLGLLETASPKRFFSDPQLELDGCLA